DPVGLRRRFSWRRAPRQAPEVIHIMLDEAACGIGGHDFAMACSPRMSKRKLEKDEPQRNCRPRSAGDLVGAIGDPSFRRFGFVQGAIVSRWAEIVGERYAKASSPESIRFPTGKR